MSFCTNCGYQMTDNSKFCANCGTPAIQSSSNTERKTIFDGEIHKCPNCGELLRAFETVCPTCQFELRGTKSSNSVSILAEKLEKATSENQKITIIKNFPIPNTKEDIFEFMFLAYSNFDAKYYAEHQDVEDISDAWLAKIEQCYSKAMFSFGNSKEFEHIQNLYDKTLKDKKKNTTKKFLKRRWKIFLCLILAVLSLTMMIVGVFMGEASGDSDSPYYALMVLGFFPLAAVGFIILDSISKNKEQKRKQFMGDVWDFLRRK